MATKITTALLLAATLGLGGLAACDKKDSPAENVMENVKDGLNVRDNEKMKDAGENLQDAAKDASEAMKDKAEEVKEDVKN